MPRVTEHLAQAVHNCEFSDAIDPAQFADWAITSRFYAAVHVLRAWLAAQSVPEGRMDTHTKVDSALAQLGLDRQIQTAYRDLKTLSRQARYECYVVADLTAEIQVAQELYDEIENHTLPLILSLRPSTS